MEQPHDGSVDEVDADAREHGGVEKRRDDLGPPVAEGPGPVRLPPGNTVCEPADEQGHDVAEIMQRVAEERERTGDDPARNLCDGDDAVEYDGDKEFPAAEIVMVVMLMVIVLHGVFLWPYCSAYPRE